MRRTFSVVQNGRNQLQLRLIKIDFYLPEFLPSENIFVAYLWYYRWHQHSD